jgi:uncharacterized protein (TIGR03086 family)
METFELLDQGYAWTAARIAAVPADGLDRPTPCTQWRLQELLDHTVGALAMLTGTVEGSGPIDPATLGSWDRAVVALADRSRAAWQAPGVMDRTFDLPIGRWDAPTVVQGTLLECVVHGWDVGQATGEAAAIPDALALAVLDFARTPAVDANRGDAFAADLDTGDTPSDQLVAFLGRTPR